MHQHLKRLMNTQIYFFLNFLKDSTNKSENKYNSNCGWPSFDDAIENKIEYGIDYKIGYPRIELKCKNCGSHLGHMFDDGPKDTTGKRHCINSIALNFKPI